MLRKIIFIYDADSGPLAGLLDSLKKAVGSANACSLCTITHGLFSEKEEWSRVERSLGAPTEYYHRDFLPQAVRLYLGEHNLLLPVVLVEDEDRGLATAVQAETLASCAGSPGCLGEKIRAALPAAS